MALATLIPSDITHWEFSTTDSSFWFFDKHIYEEKKCLIGVCKLSITRKFVKNGLLLNEISLWVPLRKEKQRIFLVFSGTWKGNRKKRPNKLKLYMILIVFVKYNASQFPWYLFFSLIATFSEYRGIWSKKTSYRPSSS